MHRLRHSVGTDLVGEDKLLKAQARLGHRDPATALRHYAQAVPLDDRAIADAIADAIDDAIDDMLNRNSVVHRT